MGGIGQLSRYVYPGHFISYALPLTFWIIFIGLGWSFTMSLEGICKHEILGGKWCTLLNFMCVFSLIWLFETLWTVAHQVHLSMGFPRQESWSGLSFSPPGDLPTQGSSPHLLGLLHCRRILYLLSHWGSLLNEIDEKLFSKYVYKHYFAHKNFFFLLLCT